MPLNRSSRLQNQTAALGGVSLRNDSRHSRRHYRTAEVDPFATFPIASGVVGGVANRAHIAPISEAAEVHTGKMRCIQCASALCVGSSSGGYGSLGSQAQ